MPYTFYDHRGQPYDLTSQSEIKWRISAYACIFRGDEILMVIPKNSPLYEFPGGGVEPYESLEQGLVRECYEETGYQVKLSNNKPFFVWESNFHMRSTNQFFHALKLAYWVEILNPQETSGPVMKDEIETMTWVKLSYLNNQNCHSNIFPVIAFLQNRK